MMNVGIKFLEEEEKLVVNQMKIAKFVVDYYLCDYFNLESLEIKVAETINRIFVHKHNKLEY